jgi:hypothetical protein
MLEEEYSISIEDLQKKFQKWFGKPVPAEPQVSAEAGQSMGRFVPVDLSLPATTNPVNHETRSKQADNLQKFSELLNLGFTGAVLSGAVVGAIIFILNLSFPGWYSAYWPNQFIIIFLVILLGFNIGLSKGYVAQQREKYFYKGEF